jgi:hypothetical protein
MRRARVVARSIIRVVRGCDRTAHLVSAIAVEFGKLMGTKSIFNFGGTDHGQGVVGI